MIENRLADLFNTPPDRVLVDQESGLVSLLDEHGVPRVAIGPTEDGFAGLCFFGKDGKPAAMLGVNGNGEFVFEANDLAGSLKEKMQRAKE